MNIAPNIMAANTQAYPYWPRLNIQRPELIPGQSMAWEVQDIPLNKIPGDWNGEYNDSDIRAIPVPNAPNNDITASQKLEVHSADLGRGAAIGLFDLFAQTQNEVGMISGNR